MATEAGDHDGDDVDYRRVFERSPDAILLYDRRTGRVRDANEAAVDLLGRSRDRLRETTVGDLLADGEDPGPVGERAVETGSARADWDLDGADEPLRVNARLTPAADGSERLFAFLRDPTCADGAELAAGQADTDPHLAAVEHLPVVLFALDPDGTFTMSRGKGLEALGLDPGEAVGNTVHELYADAPEVLASAERALAGEEVRTTTDVGGLTFETWYRPVVEDGDLQRVIGVSLDVTERAQRERHLAENEALLRQLTEATDDVYWLFDGDFSELLFINDAYEDVWGRSVEALQEDPMDFMQGVHPEDRDQVIEAVERLRDGESVDLQYRVDPTADFERWVWVRGEPIVGEDGTVERVAGFARDVTERVEREQELDHRKRQFEAVFNDPHLLTGVLDTDGVIQRVNETALELTDASQEEIVGAPFAETPWWSHDEALQADVREWIERAAAGEYVEFEAAHPLPDGSEAEVEGTIRPVTDGDGGVISLIASARDVTERNDRERQLEQSNERLEQFAYVASHDLQEPLRTISNYLSLLTEEYSDDLDEEAMEFLDIAVTASDRMQSMINGLLDYSRVTTRGNDFQPVDTEAIVADVADGLELILDDEDGTLHWEDLPTVAADPDQFGQVIQNLVKNALEHAEGPVEVEISATDEGDRYRFAVADDGPGIAPNRQEKIFRIFKSSEQYQTTSQAKGLGLAICDNVVRRHGGEIHVESEPGEGATFVFTIPKQTDDATTVHP